MNVCRQKGNRNISIEKSQSPRGGRLCENGKFIQVLIILIAIFRFEVDVNAMGIDTSKIILNSKMRLVHYLNCFEEIDYYQTFLEITPEYHFVSSSGFDSNFSFYYLRITPIISDIKTKTNDTVEISTRNVYFKNMDYNFYFAYNKISNSIYLLNGNYHNDFGKLLSDVKFHFENNNGFSLRDKYFLSNYSISGLDLRKLYKWYFDLAKKKCKCDLDSPIIYNGTNFRYSPALRRINK